MFKVPEQYRVKNGPLGSDNSFGNNGVFVIPHPVDNLHITIVASDGWGWEHVSVSLRCEGGRQLLPRTPTWEEMCYIKNVFWGEDDCVVQYHPPKSEYVNRHNYCLHLWRKVEGEFPMPLKYMVG